MPFHAAVRALSVALMLMATTMVTAAEPVPAKVEAAIRAQLGASIKDTDILAVRVSPIAGLFEVELDTGETPLVTADGLYLVSGDVFQTMPGKGLVNLSERGKGEQRRAALAKADRAQMVTFPAKGREKSFLYVFTDVDCGYCRKLHQEVPKLNAAGITVHYLAFPRTGMGTESSRKMDSVWCAMDRTKAMTDSKRGVALPPAPATCKSAVAAHFKMGNALGLRGTPAVFGPDGVQYGGYAPADKLIEDLLGK